MTTNLFFKRKNTMVNKPVQMKLIAVLLFSILIGLVLFFCIAFFFYRMVFNPHAGMGLVISKQIIENGTIKVQQLAWQESLALIFIPVVLNSVIVMITVAILSFLYSNRIAGPVYRIQQDVNAVLSGAKNIRIKIRKKDAFPELAQSINLLFEKTDNSK